MATAGDMAFDCTKSTPVRLAIPVPPPCRCAWPPCACRGRARLHHSGDGRLRYLVGAHLRCDLGGELHVAYAGQAQQLEALRAQRKVIEHQRTAQAMQRGGHVADFIGKRECRRRVDLECDRSFGRDDLARHSSTNLMKCSSCSAVVVRFTENMTSLVCQVSG